MNWDLLSVSRPEPILEAIRSGRPVLTEPYMLPDMSNPDEVAEYEAWKDFFRGYVDSGEDPGEPAFDIQYVQRVHHTVASIIGCNTALTKVVGRFFSV
jgi:predicted secreted Zn-dependent protease